MDAMMSRCAKYTLLVIFIALHSGVTIAEQNSRVVRPVTKEQYNIFVDFLRARGELGISHKYITQSHEENIVEAIMLDNKIMVSTFLHDQKGRRWVVAMTDSNIDSMVDRVVHINEETHEVKKSRPDQKVSKLMWNLALQIMLNQSGCCSDASQ